MIGNALVLIVGFVLLVKGADLFVDGAVGVAELLRVPPVVVGLTVVAMGTSLPEASVSVAASLAGSNGMSFGNVIGSNIFNLMVVVGVCALLCSFSIERELLVRDFPVCIGASILLVLFMLDGVLLRWEALVFLVLMAAYILLTVFQALKARTPAGEAGKEKASPVKCGLLILIGAAAIMWGGDLTVNSASAIASALGLSQALIGLTIVAVGTSLPELATSVVAAKKGESGLALGNAIGSSIFNILFILGLAGVVNPIEGAAGVLPDAIVMTVLTTALFVWCRIKGRMNKTVGGLCIAAYAGYMVYLLAGAL